MYLKQSAALVMALSASVSAWATRQALSVHSGDYMACALLDDHSVKCWGHTGFRKQVSTPQAVPALQGAVQIEVYSTGYQLCGRFSDGKVLCGVAGDSSVDGFESPRFMRLSSKFALGEGHGCTIQDHGKVACWGANHSGQLGRGNSSDEEDVPQVIEGLPEIKDLVLGSYSSCAIDKKNSLWCWGRFFDSKPELQSAYGAVDAVAMNREHVCIAHSNTIDCFGERTVHMEGIVGVVQLTLGDWGFYGRKNDGSVFYVQVVNVGRGEHQAEPLPKLKGSRFLSASDRNACTIPGDGSVKCWGDNSHDQLGLGPAYSVIQPTPRSVPGLANIQKIVSYPNYYGSTFAVDEQGVYFLIKKNATVVPLARDVKDYAEADRMGSYTLKDGRHRLQGYWYFYSEYSKYYNKEIVTSLTASLDFQISTGHGCALMSDGTVSCLGFNQAGQIGVPTDTKLFNEPVSVPGLDHVQSIGVGYSYNCALLGDSTVKCWGEMDDYNFGYAPKTVENLAGVVQIATGFYHACALTNDGTVSCWGNNGTYQLGHTGEGSSKASSIQGLSGVVEVAVGAGHSCARKADGSVYCWGSNHEGQLGIGSRQTDSEKGISTPMRVALSAPAISLSPSRGHSCAILEDKTVQCWGRNYSGELGLGFTSNIPLAEIPGPIQFD